MTNYRVYVLNRQERVADTREHIYDTDREALAAAETARNGHYAVEVWTGERLVGRLGGEFLLG